MATASRHRKAKDFNIHEDDPYTEDAGMNTEVEDEEGHADHDHDGPLDEDQEPEQDAEEEDEGEGDGDGDGSMSDEEMRDDEIRDDEMTKLQDAFPGFKHKYRLIKRIGEGTFSTVYKAEDLQYEQYDNKWDLEKENEKWSLPPKRSAPPKRQLASKCGPKSSVLETTSRPQRRPKYVAIKKIYVTSSPQRILNELELLHDLRNCPAVCPLVTAFRSTDQVIAILPYFRHQDFRDYFRDMTVIDMSIYLRSLFTALAYVHDHDIIHRDIKPTNFLYDPASQRGVLVDFGLAERAGTDCRPCACRDDPVDRRHRLKTAFMANGGPQHGYPKNDTRPSRRANRAGTRGFRAPEVLFKCTEQTTKIDIWSAGVILLTILSRRFPFFNSADDVEAMIEIATIFGVKRMRVAGQLHGCMFDCNIPTIGQSGFDLGKIIMWSTVRTEANQPFTAEERVAVDFLTRCMDLDPSRRISAEEALESEFLRLGQDGVMSGEEEDLDILRP